MCMYMITKVSFLRKDHQLENRAGCCVSFLVTCNRETIKSPKFKMPKFNLGPGLKPLFVSYTIRQHRFGNSSGLSIVLVERKDNALGKIHFSKVKKENADIIITM